MTHKYAAIATQHNIGLVPKTMFIKWIQIQKDVKDLRAKILYHFSKAGKFRAKTDTLEEDEDDEDRPFTRSSIAKDDDDDWAVDMEAATCDVTSTRRLDRYPLEQIMTLPLDTKLLLLVRVDNPLMKLFPKAPAVNELQKLKTRLISGREYYQLKCSISQLNENELAMTGVSREDYNLKRFQNDFNRGIGGFQVRFDGSAEVMNLTWKQVI